MKQPRASGLAHTTDIFSAQLQCFLMWPCELERHSHKRCKGDAAVVRATQAKHCYSAHVLSVIFILRQSCLVLHRLKDMPCIILGMIFHAKRLPTKSFFFAWTTAWGHCRESNAHANAAWAQVFETSVLSREKMKNQIRAKKNGSTVKNREKTGEKASACRANCLAVDYSSSASKSRTRAATCAPSGPPLNWAAT